MSYGAGVVDITQAYKDDPEQRRRIEALRQQQGANPSTQQPEWYQRGGLRQYVQPAADAVADYAGKAWDAAKYYVPPELRGKIEAAPEIAAASTPTYGLEDYRAGNAALEEGRYGEAAKSYVAGAANQVLDTGGPVTHGLAVASKAVAKPVLAALGLGAKRIDPMVKAAMDLRREYQGKAARTPVQEWTYELGGAPPEIAPAKTFDVNKLQVGDTIQPLPGDRSRVSAPLVGVGGERLGAEVSAEGGADYMRTPGGIWASQRPIIARQQKDASKSTGTPYAMTTTMGPTAIDYSHHAWEPLLWQMDKAPASAEARASFDATMRQKHPGWPGVGDPERAIQYLHNEDTGARTTFMSELKSLERQKQGFPEPGPVRWAMTEPALRGAKTGSAGYGVARLDPQGKIVLDPEFPHTSYHTQLPGTYEGQLGELLPYETVWRDWAARPDVTRLPPSKASNKLYKFSRDMPVQTVDQQLIDEMGRRIEAEKRGR